MSLPSEFPCALSARLACASTSSERRTRVPDPGPGAGVLRFHGGLGGMPNFTGNREYFRSDLILLIDIIVQLLYSSQLHLSPAFSFPNFQPVQGSRYHHLAELEIGVGA